jgi:GDPmannose 4,6-dehydratase
MGKIALISGVTGQDGSYLADLLLEKEYTVFGLIRRVSTPNYNNIGHLLGNSEFHLLDGDLTDLPSLVLSFKESMPDEAYNLGAMTFVGTSWTQPVLTINVTGLGAVNFFEAARQVKPDTKVYQAGSSEQYGNSKTFPQNEETPFHPNSPYAAAKVLAHETARIYRESFDIPISRGILFNHEGPRRGIEFVTQKIVDTAVRQVWFGEDIVLELGNLESKRDWSHAKDMVRGMWMMLQREPDDFVLASGEAHTVKEFVEAVYDQLGIFMEWYDDNGYQVGWAGKVLVKSVPQYYRPNELHTLLGNPYKARTVLGWTPEYLFEDLIEDMVSSRITAGYPENR